MHLSTCQNYKQSKSSYTNNAFPLVLCKTNSPLIASHTLHSRQTAGLNDINSAG